MRVAQFLPKLTIAGLVFVLASCGSSFTTSYSEPVPMAQSSKWRIVDVAVSVPNTLKVSEAGSLFPSADIVWREDPQGDRRPQVAKIMADATRAGGKGLHGSRPVRLELTVSRFHALTFEAETRLANAGVHDIEFTIQAVDARTGEVLAGPDAVEASLPALAGSEMVQARVRGETQKSQISAHVRKVIAGWLGIGPDPRGTFNRVGG